jgi:hypothetical protein
MEKLTTIIHNIEMGIWPPWQEIYPNKKHVAQNIAATCFFYSIDDNE